uniref:Phosphate ABC transporter substrate-binding protein, PhoT family n=1 Tax=Candidatus Kentrum sp. TUN TaxID=2126343 RepID=A0A451AC44_9GAMM|nr:MAG: phosphate ABC transporter substrate-binding protein, PhoT family [Candidatus Kentron sp. TUN]VFK63626.1 MAG: phosphate ABC transporter substrate-binding protein, PhoT family [Candidatus Kentron sp. TUN]VFK67968.1 MAG: phosphate ABC transporter substrate-binding protein, PhoT family [Candidatus Kentron sp. TUN]
MIKKIIIGTVLATFVIGGSAFARNYISIVGSSTVYPFATVVAEQFGKTSSFKTPKIESTGSGGGLKLFCSGVGVEYPDITNASRRIKSSEVKSCAKNDVTSIIEVKIGYDGIIIANSRKAGLMELTRKEIFMALAKQVPDPKTGKLIDNPHKTWEDVNKTLPASKIEVLGPPPTSGTRDAFVELALGGGAKKFPLLKELHGIKRSDVTALKETMAKLGLPANLYDDIKKKKGKAPKGKDIFKVIAHAIREDGTFIEAGENDNLIVQKLDANPKAFGVFGYSFLEQNADKVQGAKVDGVEPTFEDISNGKYPVSRPLFFYVKKAHIKSIPGMQEYLAEFTSEKAWGTDGYLADKGMIPMPDVEREKFRRDVGNFTDLQL